MSTEEEKEVSSLTQIAAYTDTARGLADLKQKFGGLVVDVTTPKGMKEARACTFELRTLRTTLEKTRKEIKEPVIARGKLIDSEAKRIESEIRALEEPIDLQIKTEETRVELERQERDEAERVRRAEFEGQIAYFREAPGLLVGKPSVIIAGQLAKLEAHVIDEDHFAEFHRDASDARELAVLRVKQLHAVQVEHEAEQKRIVKERAELEAMRAENDRLRREADERVAAERAEVERIARQDREAEEAAQARAAAIERGKQQKAAAAEREKLAAERAKVEAEQQKERDRLAGIQRGLEQKAALIKSGEIAAKKKAERERMANLGLREAAQAVVDHWNDTDAGTGWMDQYISDLAAALKNDAENVAIRKGITA